MWTRSAHWLRLRTASTYRSFTCARTTFKTWMKLYICRWVTHHFFSFIVVVVVLSVNIFVYRFNRSIYLSLSLALNLFGFFHHHLHRRRGVVVVGKYVANNVQLFTSFTAQTCCTAFKPVNGLSLLPIPLFIIICRSSFSSSAMAVYHFNSNLISKVVYVIDGLEGWEQVVETSA